MSDPLTPYQDRPDSDRPVRRPSEPYHYASPGESNERLNGVGEVDEHSVLMRGDGQIQLRGDDTNGGLWRTWGSEKPSSALMNGWRDTPRESKRNYLLLGLAAFVVMVLMYMASGPSAPEGWKKDGYRWCERDRDFECGFIAVPMDYRNPTAKKVDIAVSRYRATNLRRRIGSLFINAGGPGGSTIDMAFVFAKPLSKLLQGRYDIVAFDPRGVGATKPQLSCFPSVHEAQEFRLNNILGQGFSVPPGDPEVTENRAVIVQQMRDWLALSRAQFDLCLNATNADQIPYMGTSTVARDIDHLTTVLDGKDGLINYLGPSYGSVLGSVLVNMFPDRVGRVVLDGIVDPYHWTNTPANEWLDTWLNGTERTWEYLLTECGTVGPKVCSLAKLPGENAAEIIKRVDSWIDGLYVSPIAFKSRSADVRSGTITSGMVRALIYHTMTMPVAFANLTQAISSAMDGDYGRLAALTLPPLSSSNEKQPGDVARSIIACLDAPPFDKDKPDTWPKAEALADVAIRRLKEVSPRFGMSVSLFEPDGACQYLASAAHNLPERFHGPFNHTLRNTVLIVNPDLDPLTPLTSARWLNEQFGESARLVIQQKTPAHTSLWFGPSLCTAEMYRRYFVSGQVPEEKETLCSNELRLFESKAPKSGGLNPDQVFRDTVKELQSSLYHLSPATLPV